MKAPSDRAAVVEAGVVGAVAAVHPRIAGLEATATVVRLNRVVEQPAEQRILVGVVLAGFTGHRFRSREGDRYIRLAAYYH